MKLGEELDDDEINEIITNVDPKKTGKIFYEAFCAYIMSKWNFDRTKTGSDFSDLMFLSMSRAY